MADVETPDQEIDTPVTDEALWDSVGDTTAEPSEETTESTEVSEEIVEVEPSSESAAEEDPPQEETFEVEHEEQPSHNYEKRYKDLEREFHKRNEDTKLLRDEFQQMRLDRLELQNSLEKERKAKSQPVVSEPDPSDEA